MTYKEIKTMIASIGVPYAYNHFTDDTGREPPFICFLYDDASNDMIADDQNYQAIRPLSIELYTPNKDFTLEQTVEDTLVSNGLPFVRTETYLDSERMYMIVYDTEIVVTKEIINNG